jgi:hypothetical protein
MSDGAGQVPSVGELGTGDDGQEGGAGKLTERQLHGLVEGTLRFERGERTADAHVVTGEEVTGGAAVVGDLATRVNGSGRPTHAANEMVDQGLHVPGSTRRRHIQLVGPDRGQDGPGAGAGPAETLGRRRYLRTLHRFVPFVSCDVLSEQAALASGAECPGPQECRPVGRAKGIATACPITSALDICRQKSLEPVSRQGQPMTDLTTKTSPHSVSETVTASPTCSTSKG